MIDLVVLRLVHIVPGVFWVGTAIFLAAFLEPALKRLGPAVEGPVMAAVGRTAGPVLTICGFLTVGVGLLLTELTPAHSLGDLFATPWGWAIGLGAIVSFVAVGLGLLQGSTAGEIGRIMQSSAGHGPGPAQAARLAELGDRIRLVGRIDAVLVLLAVVLMASARFVR